MILLPSFICLDGFYHPFAALFTISHCPLGSYFALIVTIVLLSTFSDSFPKLCLQCNSFTYNSGKARESVHTELIEVGKDGVDQVIDSSSVFNEAGSFAVGCLLKDVLYGYSEDCFAIWQMTMPLIVVHISKPGIAYPNNFPLFDSTPELGSILMKQRSCSESSVE
ncbi:hypothetical protein OROMI_001022 [Orobanche minor]